MNKYEYNPWEYYPEYTKASIKNAMNKLLSKHGRLDSITLNYYLSPKKYGGLGMGKLKKVI